MKLAGMKVLDLTRFLPGPYVTQMLADHGAEVIKIESHEGEPTRGFGTPVDGMASYFHSTQRGKQSVVLNLKSPAGLDLFLRLADTADVVLESFRPGVAKKLGIDYETLSARRPSIVYCSISAFGQTGPLRERISHDLGVQALAGALSLGSESGSKPPIPGIPAADTAVSLTAIAGILMAILKARETGIGDYVDASMFDSVLSWTPQVTDAPFTRQEAPNNDRERIYGGAAFYRVYETCDNRFIALSGSEPAFARHLLSALDRPDLIPLCEQPAGDVQLPVREFLTETFLTRSRDEWTAFLSQYAVCFSPVLDLCEAYSEPQTAARDMVHVDSRGARSLGTPLKFARERARAGGTAPALGEHTDSVLQELGLSLDEVNKLREQGVVK